MVAPASRTRVKARSGFAIAERIERRTGGKHHVESVGERRGVEHFLQFGESQPERHPPVAVCGGPAQRSLGPAADPQRHPFLDGVGFDDKSGVVVELA